MAQIFYSEYHSFWREMLIEDQGPLVLGGCLTGLLVRFAFLLLLDKQLKFICLYFVQHKALNFLSSRQCRVDQRIFNLFPTLILNGFFEIMVKQLYFPMSCLGRPRVCDTRDFEVY